MHMHHSVTLNIPCSGVGAYTRDHVAADKGNDWQNLYWWATSSSLRAWLGSVRLKW